ncbi:PilX N-terminal domain-containing pilus assembly protein [Ectothiorhodospira lacustris]|uniref:PilX N-terminal domain-containing pilus assembly protein n=1 Tax=Ectothiorhodospira lacustris TaxID=2899127 RepID=UPI001EE7BEF8|nr:PilX N-terminal domain-containing pilus assembly protein [Ectothiorhodospira lacustris]MCG5509646.1 PilX N-terminal domain-containing pilus assembly protein [Ectothiorhodospira lacustris]MCG5521559.1 PilX N-terminal domain-containing pilus assembly protein [Ectothiorhodospira lacustris]
MSISPVRERGAVLVVSLVLLVLATLVGVSGISTALIQERIAGNHKQISDAFMAAESGLVNVVNVLADASADAWDSEEGMLAAIGGSGPHYVSGPGGAYWTAEVDYPYLDDERHAEITVTGEAAGIGARRVLKLNVDRYLGPPGSGDPVPDSAYTCIGAACELARVLPKQGKLYYNGGDWLPPSELSCEVGNCLTGTLLDEAESMAGIHLVSSEGHLTESETLDILSDLPAQITGEPQIKVTLPDAFGGPPGGRGWQEYVHELLNGRSEMVSTLELGLSADTGSLGLGDLVHTETPGVYHITGSGSIGLSENVHGAGVLVISGGMSDNIMHTVNLFPSKGTFIFEGLVILVNGAIVNTELANISIYGAVVTLLDEHAESGGGLMGNVDIRYSSKALEQLTEHRLWDPLRPEFTWTWREVMDQGQDI